MDRTKKIAFNGLIIAVSVVLLVVGYLTKVKISFLALTSFVLGVSLQIGRIKNGLVSALAVNILSFVLISNPFYTLAFLPISFYPAIKFLSEKKRFSYLLKFAYFNIALVYYYLLSKLFAIEINFPVVSLLLGTILLQFIFLMYDYVFTKFLRYIQHTVM